MYPELPRRHAMPAKYFISYRRNDSSGSAGRIHDRLEHEFGADLIFMDVDAIPLGKNFIKVLQEEVAKCDVLLAIIGPSWLDVRDDAGHRRLDDPNDLVRVEIATALHRDIPVIPILVDKGRIPKADQLPDDLKELSLRHGLEVRHDAFRGDMERLIRGIKGQARQIETLPPAPPQARVDEIHAVGKNDEAALPRQSEDLGPVHQADTGSAAEVTLDAAAQQPKTEPVGDKPEPELPTTEPVPVQPAAEAVPQRPVAKEEAPSVQGEPATIEGLQDKAAAPPEAAQMPKFAALVLGQASAQQAEKSRQAFTDAKGKNKAAALAEFIAAYPDSDCIAEARLLHAELVAREKKQERKDLVFGIAVAAVIFIGIPAVIVIVWGWTVLLWIVGGLAAVAIVTAVLASGYGQQAVSAIALLIFASIVWNLWKGNCEPLMIQWWPSFLQPLTRMCQSAPKFKPPDFYPNPLHPSVIPKQP
jgi:TIR domain